MKKETLRYIVGLTLGLNGCIAMAGYVIEYDKDGNVVSQVESKDVKEGAVLRKLADGRRRYDLGKKRYRIEYPDGQTKIYSVVNNRSQWAYLLEDGTKLVLTEEENGKSVEQKNPDGTTYRAKSCAYPPDNNYKAGYLREKWVGSINNGERISFVTEIIGCYGLWKLVPHNEPGILEIEEY